MGAGSQESCQGPGQGETLSWRGNHQATRMGSDWPSPHPFPQRGAQGMLPPGRGRGAERGQSHSASTGLTAAQDGQPGPRLAAHSAPEETADFPGNCRVGLQGLILAFSEVSLALVKHNRYFLSWRGALPARWFRLAALRPLARRVRQPQRSVQQQPPPHRHQAVPGTRPSIRATPAPPPPCSC